MPGGLLAMRRRIRSIDNTKKITKAMELVATAKLKRVKSRMEEVSLYTDSFLHLMATIFANVKGIEHPLIRSQAEGNQLFIIVTSSLGLCGAYNTNIIKSTKAQLQPGDELAIVGTKGITHFKRIGRERILDLPNDPIGEEYQMAVALAKFLMERIQSGDVAQVKFIYTHYVNSITFSAETLQLLPIDQKVIEQYQPEHYSKDTLFEPSPGEVLDRLIPMYIEAVVYGKLLEAHVSEQASRRTAMENATDNAEEIKETLNLKFNKLRQAAITQEISEVVAGANAL
jgi:F-type H+-transporting ATPase subunit gamma